MDDAPTAAGTEDGPNAAERLRRYLKPWRAAVDDVVALLRTLQPGDWERPTDLAGWNVRAVAAHLAHLESELAGYPQDEVQVPDAAHINGLMGRFTERGPLARAGWESEQVVAELEQAAAAREAALLARPPADLSAIADGFAGVLGWTWHTLLSNRIVDVWMHDQDIRRAVGRPGGLDSPAAAHVAEVFARSLPFVVGKRVAPRPGTTVVLEVTGSHPRTLAVRMGEDGRARPLAEAPLDADVRVVLAFEDWVLLAGGRRPRGAVPVALTGDEALGQRVLAAMAVTP